MCSPLLVGATGGLFAMLAGQSTRRYQQRLANQQVLNEHQRNETEYKLSLIQSKRNLEQTATNYSRKLSDLQNLRDQSVDKSNIAKVNFIRAHQEATDEGTGSRSAGRQKSLELFNQVQRAEQLQMSDGDFARGTYLAKAEYQNKQEHDLNIGLRKQTHPLIQPGRSRFADFLSGWTDTMTASKQLATGFSPIV